MVSVKVSEKTLERLKEIKEEEELKTLDGVIRHLFTGMKHAPKYEDHDTIFHYVPPHLAHITEEEWKKYGSRDSEQTLTFIMNLINDGLREHDGGNPYHTAGMNSLALRNIVFYLHDLIETE